MSSQTYNVPACTDTPAFCMEKQSGVDSQQNEMLLFAFEYPPASGGISRVCGEIANNFKRQNARANVLTQRTAGCPSLCATTEIRVNAGRPLREFQAFRWLRKLGRKRKSGEQITICGIWYPEGLIAYLAGVRPLVILAHGSELLPPLPRWRRSFWSALQRWVLERAELVVANSEYSAKLVARVAPKAKVQAVALAVDTNRFAPANQETAKAKFGLTGKRVVCSVSRLHHYKGHDVVLRAIASLPSEEKERIVYLIAGQGPHEQELKDLASSLSIDRQVRWMGFVAEEQLPEVYYASDLFVLCTRQAPEERAVEGFGMVFLEAQSCSVPVIGTDTGGIPDAIRDGEGGWLIKQDDTAKLAQRLRQLVYDPEFFRQAGKQARQRVLRECTMESYGRRFSNALQSAGIFDPSWTRQKM